MIRTIMIVMMVVVVMILVRYYNVGDVGCDGLMMVMMMVRYCWSADLWIPAWAQRLYCCCGGIVGAGCRLILLILL